MVCTGDHNHPDRAGVVVSRGNDYLVQLLCGRHGRALDLERLIYLISAESAVAIPVRSSGFLEGQHGDDSGAGLSGFDLHTHIADPLDKTTVTCDHGAA